MAVQNAFTGRRQIQEIADQATYVAIDMSKASDLCQIMKEDISRRWWGSYLDAPEHYHLNPFEKADVSTIMFYLINMAQMWLIWEVVGEDEIRPWQVYIGDELYIGASSITASHWRAISRGQNLLDPTYLANMSIDDVADVYRDDQSGAVTLQNLPGRLAKFNEIGQSLLENFEGDVTRLLETAQGYLYRDNDTGLVQLLGRHFPISYGDWPFNKLANIFALALWHIRQSEMPHTETYMRLTVFHDLENVEAGADYYRPLFLMRVGILRPEGELRERLSRKMLIERDSQMEQEYRATTLEALRAVTEQVGEFPQDLYGVEIETHAQAFLRCRHCRVGISDEELYCPYKPVCAAYNGVDELMQISWPLVLTTAY